MDVVVGRVGRAHGIRGEVAVELRTDDPSTRFAVGAVLRPEPSARNRLTVRNARAHGHRLLVTFVEVGDRTQAESLRGASLVIDVASGGGPPDPEEFYDHQLVGLSVRTTDGRAVGTVRDVRHLPAQDLLVVADADDGDDHLVPFVRALVPEVDVAGGTLLVDAPPGLLDPDAVDDPGP